jgi:hypothetical protein
MIIIGRVIQVLIFGFYLGHSPNVQIDEIPLRAILSDRVLGICKYLLGAGHLPVWRNIIFLELVEHGLESFVYLDAFRSC